MQPITSNGVNESSPSFIFFSLLGLAGARSEKNLGNSSHFHQLLHCWLISEKKLIMEQTVKVVLVSFFGEPI